MSVRFTYSTNGQGIYAVDMETGIEAEVSAYPTPEELWNLTFTEQNVWRDRFSGVPFAIKGWPLLCLIAVCAAVALGRVLALIF